MALFAIAFYVLAAVTLLSGVAVVSARNPVHSVLFLIAAFFSAAVKSMDVNCDPWSVLKISGLP